MLFEFLPEDLKPFISDPGKEKHKDGPAKDPKKNVEIKEKPIAPVPDVDNNITYDIELDFTKQENVDDIITKYRN